MKNDIQILRVDPNRRAIAALKIRVGKNAVGEVKRLCRAKTVGWRELLTIESKRLMGRSPDPHVKTPVDLGGTVLVVAGGLEVDEAMKGWRLKGGEDTAGIGILFGKGSTGGMDDCPVDVGWLSSRIVWLAGEDVVGREERAATMLPSVNEDVRAAVLAAIPAPDGDMWIPVDHQAQFEAVLALGLGTPSTKGQRLSPLGNALRDLLDGEAS